TTITFAGTYTENGAFISDSTTTFFMDAILNPGGTWTGGVGANVYVNGALNWSGGAMSGTGGVTYAQGMSTINGSADKTLSGWTLNNQSPATMSGSGTLRLGNGTVLNNTSTIDVQSDAGLVNSLGGLATFVNSGTLRKSASAG